MSKPSSKPPRGMRDLLPRDVELRDHVQAVIQRTYRRYGYTRVETPCLESLALLTSGQGGENEKLIYRILERGEKFEKAVQRLVEAGAASGVRGDDVGDASAVDRDAAAALTEIGLRYDLTVPLARFYAEHHAELPNPFKAIQIGPVWRAERPQKGRFRQFVQCDIDVLGDGGECVEAELVAATAEVFTSLGLSGFEVRFNDRRLLTALGTHCGLGDTDNLFITLDKIDKIGRDGVREQLVQMSGDAGRVDQLLGLLQPEDGSLPQLDVLAAYVGEAIKQQADALRPVAGDAQLQVVELDKQFSDLLAGVNALHLMQAGLAGALPRDVVARFDPSLVRGMGYYTGPIFELGLAGYGFSLAGGGRYDRMIGGLLGRDVPACGFSIGFERLLLVLEERGLRPRSTGRRVALLYASEHDAGAVLATAERLRATCEVVSVLPRHKKMGKQLDELAAAGFDGFCVFDGSEAPELRPLASSDGEGAGADGDAARGSHGGEG